VLRIKDALKAVVGLNPNTFQCKTSGAKQHSCFAQKMVTEK